MAYDQNAARPPLSVEADSAWRSREESRFDDGTYKRLPPSIRHAPWFFYLDGRGGRHARSVPDRDHYAHLSLADGAKIAFTESPEKGAADRQTVMKPGKYLTKYFSHVLTADQITKIATEICAMYAPATLCIATDADDIERVYTTGTHSCMAYRASYFVGPCHPSRVYAGPDLAVAYINKADGSGIGARAVIWPEKKIFSTVYGDAIRLESALEAAGYHSGDLSGARVQKICAGAYGYVMPYVDGISSAEVRGEFITLDVRCGELDCQKQNGVTGEGYTCCSCGVGISEYERFSYTTDSDGPFCEGCYDDVTVYCDYYGETREDTAVRMANGDTWCQRAFDNHGFTCDGDGDNYPLTDRVHLVDGRVWSHDHFEEYGEEYEGDNYELGSAPRPDGDG